MEEEEERVLIPLKLDSGDVIAEELGARGWRPIEVVTDDVDMHTVIFGSDAPDLETWLVIGPTEPYHLRLVGDGAADALEALEQTLPHVRVEDLVAVIPALDEELPLLAAVRALRYLVQFNPTDVDDDAVEHAALVGLEARDPETRWEAALSLALFDAELAAAPLRAAIDRELDPELRADLTNLAARI